MNDQPNETALDLVNKYNGLVAQALAYGVTAEHVGLRKLEPLRVFHDRATALSRIQQMEAAIMAAESESAYKWDEGQPAQGTRVSYVANGTGAGVVKQAPKVGGSVVLVMWAGVEQWEPVGRLWPVFDLSAQKPREELQSPLDQSTAHVTDEHVDKPEENEVTKTAKKAKAPKDKKAKTAKAPKVVRAKKTNGNGHAVRAGSKTEIVHGLLSRKSGCTAAEVLAATGWPAVSMPAMAKACGLSLRKEKEKGSPTQYYGE